MKITKEAQDFIDFTNRHPNEIWHIDLMPWPAGHEIVWTCLERQLAMDHVLARKVSRVLRAHFLKVFRTVPAEKKQPKFEAECIHFCDTMDKLAKDALAFNRTRKKVAA